MIFEKLGIDVMEVIKVPAKWNFNGTIPEGSRRALFTCDPYYLVKAKELGYQSKL